MKNTRCFYSEGNKIKLEFRGPDAHLPDPPRAPA